MEPVSCSSLIDLLEDTNSSLPSGLRHLFNERDEFSLLPTHHPGTKVHMVDRTFKIVVDIYVVSALCLVGFIGNSLTTVVLRRDTEHNNPSNFLLQVLAMANISACLCLYQC